MHSVLNLYQGNINTIVSTLYAMGLRHAVISPGSRNAPLIMAFVRFGKIRCYSVADERVAGFVALGMSKQMSKPVAVICTSGTAVLNLYPAVAEAYYMQCPLLVITADRPAEMIGRWDGQTIRQFEVFKPHILSSLQTPENLDDNCQSTIAEISAEFYTTGNGAVKGPVHLNVPLKEPLYQAARLEFEYPEAPLSYIVKEKPEAEEISLPKFTAEKIMILVGADYQDAVEHIKAISKRGDVVVLADVISNAHEVQNISNWESVLLNASKEHKRDLSPDLLITAGKMVLNKTIKQLFRQHPPKQHWHISENGFSADTFFTNPLVLRMNADTFFGQFNASLVSVNAEYFRYFNKLSETQERNASDLLAKGFNGMTIVKTILQQLPDQLSISLANSMTVRYVAYLANFLKPGWKLYSNRGVSGIDGCTSTAVGMAMQDNHLHVLITGDVAFYYDINALWQHQLPGNFRIILLNDFGGGIFRNIDGPADLPELNPYIGTPHQFKAGHLAAHFGIRHYIVSNEEELKQQFPAFIDGPGCAILEILTDQNINSNIFKQYKSLTL